MKIKLLTITAFASLICLSPSCVWQVVDAFIRDEYPGTPPPQVVLDVNGKPATSKLLKVDHEALPAPHSLTRNMQVSYAPDGIPYSFTSEFSNILVSPYPPYHQLSYKGISGGTKVWDPYVGKPFYITRIHTFN